MNITLTRADFRNQNQIVSKNVASPILRSHLQETAKMGTLSFKGNDKNPNQALFLAAECAPYATTGGLADVVLKLPEALIKDKENGMDVRVMMPLYNAGDGIKYNENGKPVFIKYDDKATPDKWFIKELEDTGLKTEFEFGARENVYGQKPTAHLFKVKDPVRGVPVYMVYSPEISSMVKEYGKSYHDGDMFPGYVGFSLAALKLMKEVAKSDKEKNTKGEYFNPQNLHCHDWHTTFAIKKLHELAKQDDFYQGVNTPYTFHNAGDAYQGKANPTQAILNLATKEEIEKLFENTEFKDNLAKIGAMQIAREDYLKIEKTCPDQIKKLNEIALAQLPGYKNLCQTETWKDNTTRPRFNSSLIPIENKSIISTVSKGYAEEATTMNSMAPNLWDKWGNIIGIVNGESPVEFDPTTGVGDGNSTFEAYNSENIKEKRAENREKLEKLLTQEALEAKSLIKDKTYGYIDPAVKNGPLAVLFSRYDDQKGIDVLLESAKTFLKKHKEAKLIISAGPIANKDDQNFVNQFFNDNNGIFNKEPYKGRVLFIDGKIPRQKILAASDMAFVTSRYEPCGLTQLQSMRMGTVPIVTETGGLRDTVVDFRADSKNATGFKTDGQLLEMNGEEPKTREQMAKQVADAFDRAYDVYKNKPEEWWNMASRCMNLKTDWSDNHDFNGGESAVEKYRKYIYKIDAQTQPKPEKAVVTKEI